MTGYIPRWFICQQTVTDPSKRFRCRLTTLNLANALTTTLNLHPSKLSDSELFYNFDKMLSDGQWQVAASLLFMLLFSFTLRLDV